MNPNEIHNSSAYNAPSDTNKLIYETFHMISGKAHSSRYSMPVRISMKEGEVRLGCSSIEVEVLEYILREYKARYDTSKYFQLQ